MSKQMSITQGKGFRMRFANGWAVSVQFGPGNYCDNYRSNFLDQQEVGASSSNTAECACFDKRDEFATLPDFLSDEDAPVVGYLSPDKVLELMNWAAKQP